MLVRAFENWGGEVFHFGGTLGHCGPMFPWPWHSPRSERRAELGRSDG